MIDDSCLCTLNDFISKGIEISSAAVLYLNFKGTNDASGHVFSDQQRFSLGRYFLRY